MTSTCPRTAILNTTEGAPQTFEATTTVPERLSIEVTNRCRKACVFCYNGSHPDGETRWTGEDVVAFVRDCARHGTRAVSFGGGEPLEFPDIFDVLSDLRGTLFRSLTTSGIDLDEQAIRKLAAAAPDKVQVSIHYPGDVAEVLRVIGQVRRLEASGLAAGINLLVRADQLAAARVAAEAIKAAGIGADRVVYLPMRLGPRPSPEEVARVAGADRFQSTSCLVRCGPSPRFAAVDWSRRVAWCSYTPSRRPLRDLSAAGLARSLRHLTVVNCGESEHG